MSEWRKGFAKLKGEIPPAARDDAKWRGMAWSLPWRWIIGRFFGAQFHGGGQVGERIVIMRSVRLFQIFALPTKSDNRNGNCERGCKGKSIPKKSSLSD